MVKEIFERGKFVGYQCDACGKCCNAIMFNVKWFKQHRKYAVRDIVGVHQEHGVIIPFTESGKCCFLTEDNRCVVHDTKDDVCKDFFCNGHVSKPFAMNSWTNIHFRSPNGKLYALKYFLYTKEED
jgi:Fe-S-cluster containining protein